MQKKRRDRDWTHTPLAWLVAVPLLLAAAPAASADSRSDAPQSPDRLTEARESVSATLYAAAATLKAFQQSADAKLGEQRRNVDVLQAKLKTAGGRNTALQTELTQAQERFVADLALRDRAYAREMAVFRGGLQKIASTPEGEAALRLYNAGDEVGALAILDQLADAREKAQRARVDIETAEERRPTATLAFDARNKGRVDTESVIARFETITRLDPTVHWDWVELARLYADAGRLPQAREAALRSLQTAGSDRDRATAAVELGDVLVEQGDLGGARTRYQESSDTLKRLAVADPGSASLQRDVSVSLERLGDVLVAQGDLGGARTRYQEGLDIHKRLAAADPSSASLHRDLSVSLHRLGDVLEAQGDLGGARTRYQEGLDIRKRLAAADPSSASLQRDVSVSLNKLGDVLVAQGDLGGARTRYQEGMVNRPLFRGVHGTGAGSDRPRLGPCAA